MLRVFLLAIFATVVLACSDEGRTPTPVPRSPDYSLDGPIDLGTFDFRRLIYWEELYNSGISTPPPSRLQAVVAAFGGAVDEGYEPFLVDLGFHGTPYAGQVLALLLGHTAPFSSDEILAVIERRGFKGPQDDLPAYLEFKQTLFATIVPQFGEFLDPSQPRTISAQEIVWGGVTVDGIPPLNEPNFITAESAAPWILPEDQVIGVSINGDVRAYPRRIIDWHEIVNDTVGGIPVSLAYCTLCGSAILYDGRVGDRVIRFGTSGLLYRSNKLMYDWETRTLWEQFTGEPAWGPLVGSGIKLEVLPVVQTTWADWLTAHPETLVLDINTGFSRDYGSGVAYASYWAIPDLIFPAPDRDGPLERKESVYAVRIGDTVTAYAIELLSRQGFIQDRIGEENVVIIATADGSGGRAFARSDVDFRSVDVQTGTLRGDDGRVWRVTEDALVADDGEVLTRLPGHNAFWFAITNHAPQWRLYGE